MVSTSENRIVKLSRALGATVSLLIICSPQTDYITCIINQSQMAELGGEYFFESITPGRVIGSFQTFRGLTNLSCLSFEYSPLSAALSETAQDPEEGDSHFWLGLERRIQIIRKRGSPLILPNLLRQGPWCQGTICLPCRYAKIY